MRGADIPLSRRPRGRSRIDKNGPARAGQASPCRTRPKAKPSAPPCAKDLIPAIFPANADQIRGLQWVSLRSVRAFRGSRTRGCCGAAASMSTTSCCRGWRSGMCCARRTPTPKSNRSTSTKAKAAPGVLCVLTGEDWIKSGWGDLPVPGTHKRRDGSTNYKPRYPALVKDTRALRRRLRRLRRRRDQEPGDGRRRADRGRLRDCCRPWSAPPRPPSPARRWSGTTARTTSASRRSTATRPRPKRPSPRPPMW